MAKKQDNQLEDFWNSGNGKSIKSYGTWLIVYGFIIGLFSGFFFVLLLLATFSAPSAMPPSAIFALFYYAIILATAFYLIDRGHNIRKKKLTPSQIKSASTATVILVIIKIIFTVIGSIINGDATAAIGILDIIAIIEAFQYLNKWHKSYAAACGEDVDSEPEPEGDESTEQAEDDEYDDDLL